MKANRTGGLEGRGSESVDVEPAGASRATIEKVQCPNCCRMAPVTSRSMGLLFYRCELCEAFGATPDPEET